MARVAPAKCLVQTLPWCSPAHPALVSFPCDPTKPLSLAELLRHTTVGGAVWTVFCMNATVGSVPLKVCIRGALPGAFTQGRSHHQVRGFHTRIIMINSMLWGGFSLTWHAALQLVLEIPSADTLHVA